MTARCQRCGCAVKSFESQPTGVPGYWCRNATGDFKLCGPCMVLCYPQAFEPQGATS